MKVKEVSPQEARKIIETREPLGLFFCQEGKIYVGIDNSTGDAPGRKISKQGSRVSSGYGEKGQGMPTGYGTTAKWGGMSAWPHSTKDRAARRRMTAGTGLRSGRD